MNCFSSAIQHPSLATGSTRPPKSESDIGEERAELTGESRVGIWPAWAMKTVRKEKEILPSPRTSWNCFSSEWL